MIIYKTGDMFDSKAQVIVNAVNCDGIMGGGLALAFKERFSLMYYLSYLADCKTGRMRVNNPILYKGTNPWILNFATKDRLKNDGEYRYIMLGLKKLPALVEKHKIKSIAFPKLGAGLARLDWDIVKQIMEHYLQDLPCEVEIYV
jgi:O-acetyl-ADP-ribose deacetylase (regulator of RNase III)